ncbi:MAG: hypothetical protein QXO70_03240, partial [Candidatus Pacearchaeota archaeon]
KEAGKMDWKECLKQRIAKETKEKAEALQKYIKEQNRKGKKRKFIFKKKKQRSGGKPPPFILVKLHDFIDSSAIIEFN